ncbi:hypothetical protein [Mangrovicoccus sp. HB161399]|uniref:hypothetical protein n=1 Tax=Mangrovicoccus sp. HB161399 TaxID=2720392 RepID=UPI0020A6D17F|nr:hypothetical protein [Mangrovicoccus sp. HB161399]
MNIPEPIALVVLDIAKSVFQVHAADCEGKPVSRRKLKREEVEPFFRALPPCQIGLEACPGSIAGPGLSGASATT